MTICVLGVDIGTSGSKGVLVEKATGRVVAEAAVSHEVSRPRPGWVEMPGETWWTEFVTLARRLRTPGTRIEAVGVSGMGPCVLLTDDDDVPVRPAILYGVDTRAMNQAARMGGLDSQAGGPKIAWVAEEEPDVYARARRLYMPASWLVRKLTGAYVLDHQSASQMRPHYDLERETWHDWPPGLEPPSLAWADAVAGAITRKASAETGLPMGIPVTTGTIDAWAEAVSVGAHHPGDLMLMYGTTMFLIATGTATLRTPSMWTTAGAYPGTRNLAGGLATSGALTTWIRDLTGSDYPTLLAEASKSPAGANGLLMLPYFAGERTPIQDPHARGVIAGLTLTHTRGDLYRAALEATAFAVRHNLDTMRAAGARIDRVVAVGGGTQGDLWPQIVSDVTGLPQEIPRTRIGASYGSAFLAAGSPRITAWNPIVATVTPSGSYDDLYRLYLDLYPGTAGVVHALAEGQNA
ncbi:FGGY-family carbohydrate kinase [Herbidospora sp. RD11066]